MRATESHKPQREQKHLFPDSAMVAAAVTDDKSDKRMHALVPFKDGADPALPPCIIKGCDRKIPVPNQGYISPHDHNLYRTPASTPRGNMVLKYMPLQERQRGGPNTLIRTTSGISSYAILRLPGSHFPTSITLHRYRVQEIIPTARRFQRSPQHGIV